MRKTKNVIATDDEWLSEMEEMDGPVLAREDGWIIPAELSNIIGKCREATSRYLKRGVRDGRYETAMGRYQQRDGRTQVRAAYRKL